MNLIDILNKNTSEKGSWNIEYNGHKASYEDVEGFVKNFFRTDGEELAEFLDSDDFGKMVCNNTIYELHWYKETPVGSYKILTYSIERLCEIVMEIIDDRN